MANILQAVQTYQSSGLGILQNLFAFINKANKKFKDFEKMTANLGDTVTFDLPVRMVSSSGLVVAAFNGVTQRVKPLVVDQSRNVNFAFTANELIFNIENNAYEPKLAKSAMAELGSYIEADVASIIPSSTYRFYGTSLNPISTFQQLGQAMANFREFGSVGNGFFGFISNLQEAVIIGSGFTQFVPKRNDDYFNSWEIGSFGGTEFFRSNLLPTHFAGTVGNAGTTLTLISVDSTGTILTFSGATIGDTNAVKANDLFQFQDNVSGQPNLRFRTFTGHAICGLPVQFRATANAGADGSGNVQVTISPPLIATDGNVNQNISVPLAAGMQVKSIGDHKCGLLLNDDALFLAMPMLPDQNPFPTANHPDMESGASIRLTTGAQFGGNSYGSIFDSIWGKCMVEDYTMRLIFPV